MDSILPALLAVTILVLASLTLGRSSFNSFQVLGDSWQEAEERSIERVRSDIGISSALARPSTSGTTDVVALLRATTDAEDYVQASDGQLTVFVVNQDDDDWIRADDITLTIHTDSGTSVYDYTGITSPSTSHTAEGGEIDETDTIIESGAFGARRDTINGWANWGEATTGEYGNLVGSDDSHYQGADPGSGDNAAMIFEFYITEDRASITQIDVAVEAAQGAATDAWFLYLWNYTTSSYTVCCSDVDVVVPNDGATPVVDFSRMDVVVQYTSGSDSYITYVDFTTESSPQANDTWTVVSVNNDVIDPGVLNMGENMTISIRLSPPASSGSHWLQVTTELGVSASSFFTY